MSKQIQVSDELHARLKEKAESNFRSIGNHIEYLLAVDEEREVKEYEAKAKEWEEAEKNLPDAMQSPTYVNMVRNKDRTPENHNVKILEDGTVTKADPSKPEFAYSPPLSNLPSITCPKCGYKSFLAMDIQERYCANCHEYHDQLTDEKKSEAAPQTSDLFATPAEIKSGVPIIGEQACCQNELQPCKHWVWDSSTGEGFKNSLSGRFMEVE